MIISCFVLLVVTSQVVQCTMTEFSIEAEDMSKGQTEVAFRAHASGFKTVHMYKGQSITKEICLISDTEVTIQDLVYSNDGGTDKIMVSFDMQVIGVIDTLPLLANGTAWEQFRSSNITYTTVSGGQHVLTLAVVDADQYGVEIDVLHIRVNNSHSLASITCNVFCFDDIAFPFSMPNPPLVTRATAVQKSTPTKCAEEDNVNIPIFHSSVKSYMVTASLPKYTSFDNNRGPDWTNCKMASDFWKYTNLMLNQNTQVSTETSHLSFVTDLSFSTRKWRIAYIVVDFALDGPDLGSTDSEVGTNVFIKFIRYNGTLSFEFQYLNRYNSWSQIQHQTIKNGDTSVMFETSDFSFREGVGNKIRINIFSDEDSVMSFLIGELYMTKRRLKPDTTIHLYNDGITIIEGVDIDMWWRVNESMTVTIVNGTTVHNSDYIRIYRRVPWTVDGFSQVFVMYQDGNVRLLPTTPHGLDWIPFGSSVLIGQSNATSLRPCAPVSRMLVDPNHLTVKLFYADGGLATLHLTTSWTETRLNVADLYFTKDTISHPFFTLRSMYVSDGNCDVDHFSVDGQVKAIIDPWGSQQGNFFAFYRQCVSAHNTQSPDISLEITDARATT